jgi:hypothetical protein
MRFIVGRVSLQTKSTLLKAPMEELLKKVDFSDPQTEVVIVLIVAAIGLLLFWLMQSDKGKA